MSSGTPTAHGYFIKPAWGDSGVVIYTLFCAALDATDAFLYALSIAVSALSTLVTGWAPMENQDILIPNCVYAAADRFTVIGTDRTAQFTANKPVRAQLDDNTFAGSTVVSSSYAAGDTTVILNDSILTNPIGGIWLTATRDGLFPYGPGYVVARDYGVPGQAAWDDAIAAIGILERTLVLGPGDWGRPTSDPPANINHKVERGALIDPGNVDLTINGPFKAGLYQVFSLTGTGVVIFGAGAVKEVYPQWFYSGSGSWAASFQAAVNSISSGNVKVVPGTYDLSTTALMWKEKVNLIGDGIGRTNITSSAAGFAIVWTCTDGTTEREGPRFADFTLTANNGIKLNDPANGFTDDNTTQDYILRPSLERVKLIAATPNSGIGFQGSKCFSLKIADCEFFRFDKNVDWHGCDDPVLQHSRIIGGNKGLCTNAEGGTYDYGTFGNRQLVGGSCQFNLLNAGASNDFIETGAQEITIKDCYFEQGDVIRSVVKVLDGTYTFRFLNNHFGVQSNKTTYSIDFSGMTDIPQNTMVMGNFGYANLMDAVGFPAAGVKYHYNSILPRQIYHAGNDLQLDSGFKWPFNSDWAGKYTGSEVAVFSPNHVGLRTVAGSYYETVRCFSGRFRLPPLTSADFLEFNLGSLGRTITGTVTVRVIARATATGQKYKVNYLNGASVIDTQEKTLTNANQDYCLTIWSGISAADMSIRIWNEDAVGSGYVDVERIIITYD